jgi:peptide methionine sulfoxide reductase MsrB
MLAASNTGNGHNGYIFRDNPKALKGYVGYHIDSLAVFDVPWAQEVLGFLEA